MRGDVQVTLVCVSVFARGVTTGVRATHTVGPFCPIARRMEATDAHITFCLQNSECGRERCVRVKVEAAEKERKRWWETRGGRESQKEKNVSSRGGEHIEAISSTCKLCLNTTEGLCANRAVTLAFRDVPQPLAPLNRLIRQNQAQSFHTAYRYQRSQIATKKAKKLYL